MEEVAIRSAIPIAAGQRQTAAAFVGDTLGMSAALRGVHRQLAKTALEARLGTFISAEGVKSQTVAEYQRGLRFGR
jgi:hypothetical protein